jgi:hypothetical protein
MIMKIFEAVKKGFGAANKNMMLVLVLVVFNLVWNMINIAFVPQAAVPAPGADTAATPPAVPPQTAVLAIVVSAVFMLISIFMQGGALGVVRDYIKEGKAKLSAFASYGGKYYLRLLGLGVIIILIVLIIALLAALIIAATAPLNNVIATVIAAIIAITIGLAGIYFVLLIVMSPYSLICDDTGIIAAMKNSMAAVGKAFWKVLLLLVMLVLIAIGIGFLIGIAAGLLTVALPAKAGQTVIGVVNSIFNGYLGVVMMAAFMAYYLALRER